VDDHNDIGDEEDRGLGEGVLHVEEMICNKDVPDVLLQSTNKKVSITLRCLIECRGSFFTRSAKGVIRSTRCCG
jgi:hypothetical protein